MSAQGTPEVATSGTVVRSVGEHLAYVATIDGRTFPVTTDLIGRTLSELNLTEGSVVKLRFAQSSQEVASLELEGIRAPDYPLAGSADLLIAPADEFVIELSPNVEPVRPKRIPRAIPQATRDFGKLLDTETMWPGDLILTRATEPDFVSRLIVSTQIAGGYSPVDSRWTHAAMYLGDDLNVVEATFETLTDGSVRITSLDEYCQGKHAFRVRRPQVIKTERDGWRVCLRALARLGAPYRYLEALRAWWVIRFRKRDFGSAELQRAISNASLCSTLYADAVAEGTRQMLGETNGWCAPAWLSGSPDLDDVKVTWLKIQ